MIVLFNATCMPLVSDTVSPVLRLGVIMIISNIGTILVV